MSKSAKHRRVACEPLEERRMFVTYQVTGTSGADAISLSIDGNSIISAVNGVSDSASDIINNSVEINGLGGGDTITIVETGANTVVINAGTGDDTINLGLGSHDLNNIQDFVTVNGDGNVDTLFLFDDTHATGVGVTFSSGNNIARQGMADVSANVESVVLQASQGGDTIAITAALSFGLQMHGNGGADFLNLVGAAGESATYLPSGADNDSGAVTFQGSSMTFDTVETVRAFDFTNFTLTTPKPNDQLSLINGNSISGTTGGIGIAPLVIDDIGTLTIDMAAHDGATGNDTLTLAGTTSEAGVIKIDSGIGTNTLTNTGTFTIDTGVGANLGNNLTAINNGGTLTFDGAQSLKRLEINNSGLAKFNGTGTLLSTLALAVVNGVGTIQVSSNQTAIVTLNGSFAIGAGRTLTKTGAGTLSINSAQSHGAGANLEVNNGTLNMFTDAGSAAARPLSINTFSTINFSSTEHLAALGATGNSGKINVNVNGNRVIVTNLLGVDSEGSAMNLNDNDLILDYTNPIDDADVRTLLHRGRNLGAWNGNGINSLSAATNPLHNTTLGSLEATEFKSIYGAAATFDGQVLDNTMVLIKYTYYGDTDFNGVVDFDDYSRTDSGFNGHKSGWLNGDFDDNGGVDFDDYSLIDLAFNTQGNALRPARNPVGPKNIFSDSIVGA